MRIIRSLLHSLDTLLAPQLCPACRQNRAERGRLCEDCRLRIRRLQDGPRCRTCGAPLADVASAVCRRCAETPPPWFRGVCAMDYHGEAGELVRAYKYGRQTAVAEYFATEMAEAWRRYGAPARPAMLVPVPLHWIRRAQRGFNQAELLCRCLAPRLGLPLRDVLRRSRATAHQARLDAEERRKNLRKAFAVADSGAVAGESVLLVDDVMTTGATLAACTEVLYEAGAAEVSVLTVARA